MSRNPTMRLSGINPALRMIVNSLPVVVGTGTGTGDVQAVNNLTDLENLAVAKANLQAADPGRFNVNIGTLRSTGQSWWDFVGDGTVMDIQPTNGWLWAQIALITVIDTTLNSPVIGFQPWGGGVRMPTIDGHNYRINAFGGID